MASPEDLDTILARLTAGTGVQVVAVDGPAGSGKTTLAADLSARLPHAVVIHLDDLYEGWSGLPAVPRKLARLVPPLLAGRPSRYRRFDWHQDRLGPWVEVPAARTVIVEGVGAGTAPGIHTLVWVEAPADQRRLRALARDGDTFVGHWDAWAAAESVHFARHPTRDRADVVIRG